jgi:hypothetical protein
MLVPCRNQEQDARAKLCHTVRPGACKAANLPVPGPPAAIPDGDPDSITGVM